MSRAWKIAVAVVVVFVIFAVMSIPAWFAASWG